MNGSMSRRSILAAGVAGSATVLLGPGSASAAALVTHGEINSQPAFNAISGSGDSSSNTGSATQTYFVQAACQYIWGISTGIDGDRGPQTQANSSTALARAGSDGVITTQSRWLAFCEASAQQAWALVP